MTTSYIGTEMLKLSHLVIQLRQTGKKHKQAKTAQVTLHVKTGKHLNEHRQILTTTCD